MLKSIWTLKSTPPQVMTNMSNEFFLVYFEIILSLDKKYHGKVSHIKAPNDIIFPGFRSIGRQRALF